MSGLLVNKVGGPSVKSYQPAGLWTEVSVTDDAYSGGPYVQSHGDDLYRRSLYSWWKRTCRPPSLSLLDAPEREFCRVQRSRTHSPLQALVLLNDPTFVEAARNLAQRMLTEGGERADSRLAYGFRLAISRAPSDKFPFQQYGESGAWVSSLLPHTGAVADDLCIVNSMYTDAINHDPAITLLQTGSQQPGRGSMGAWISYGLGTPNENLPAFTVLISHTKGKKSPQGLLSRL